MNKAPAAEPRRSLLAYLEWLEASGRVEYLPGANKIETTFEAEPESKAHTSLSRDGAATKVVVATAAPATAAASRTPLRAQAKSWTPQQKLDFLRLEVLGDCQRCALAKGRTQLVFGQGNPEARVLLVDDAPAAAQDEAGTCLVGPAFEELVRWIDVAGWSVEELYVTNAVKCRPLQGREPAAQEASACRGFLQAQIRAVAPDLIVALGRFAGALVLGRPGLRMNQMRGISHLYRDPKVPGREIPVVVTLHPAFVLRNAKQLKSQERASQEESQVHQDFARARAALNTQAPV